jgi:hypothetical protein
MTARCPRLFWTYQTPRKRPAKRQRRVFRPAKMEGAVMGEEGFESGSENLAMSPNLLD